MGGTRQGLHEGAKGYIVSRPKFRKPGRTYKFTRAQLVVVRCAYVQKPAGFPVEIFFNRFACFWPTGYQLGSLGKSHQNGDYLKQAMRKIVFPQEDNFYLYNSGLQTSKNILIDLLLQSEIFFLVFAQFRTKAGRICDEELFLSLPK